MNNKEYYAARYKKYREKIRQRQKAYYEQNREKILQYAKEYKEQNIEKIRERGKIYREKNIENLVQKAKKWTEQNPEKRREIQKKYREKNRKKIKEHMKKYREQNRQMATNYVRQKRTTDPTFKAKQYINNLIRQALKKQSTRKNTRTAILLGCTAKEFAAHIESQFESWMKWDNWGRCTGIPNTTWNIDHIIPVSKFDLADLEQQKIAFHYTNCRPLDSLINITEGNRR
jgi:hypothetical protein